MAIHESYLGETGKTFSNWIKSNTCKPELYCEPDDTQDIVKIVAAARAGGKEVRVIGSGHSFNDQAMTNGYLVSLRKYNNVLQVDTDNHRIQVQAGVTLTQLNKVILPKHGLAISAQGIVSDITIAGAIATGTHGTGNSFGSLSSMVIGIELLTASGEILAISGNRNEDLLPAARLSLGCLGIILSVTLQCEPEFNLLQRKYPLKIEEVMEHIPVHVTSSDHFSFSWVPYTGHVICSHSSRTQMPKCPPMFSWFWHAFIGGILFETLHWLSTFFIALVPLINQFYYRVLFRHRTDIVDRSDNVFAMTVPTHFAMEWAVPRDKAALALFELNTLLENQRLSAHFPIEVRFGKADDTYLSQAYDTDVCYINLVVYKPFGRVNLADKENYFSQVRDIVTKLGGRPHWGKVTDYDSYRFSELYPKWETFRQIRQRLDPAGMFLNEGLRKIFVDS